MKIKCGNAIQSFNCYIRFLRVKLSSKYAPDWYNTLMLAPGYMISFSVSHCQRSTITWPRNACNLESVIIFKCRAFCLLIFTLLSHLFIFRLILLNLIWIIIEPTVKIIIIIIISLCSNLCAFSSFF